MKEHVDHGSIERYAQTSYLLQMSLNSLKQKQKLLIKLIN